MTIEAIVARYGLAALFAGAALEGEAAVIAGGVLAHQGVFPLAGAMAVAALGSCAADQLYFHLGRRFRDRARVKRIRARPAFERAVRALDRHPVGFIFAFRFVYGLRTVSPIAIGTAGVSPRLFMAVNAVSAATWGVAFTSIGYLFGNAFESLIGRLRHDMRLWWIVGGLLLGGIAFELVRRFRKARA